MAKKKNMKSPKTKKVSRVTEINGIKIEPYQPKSTAQTNPNSPLPKPEEKGSSHIYISLDSDVLRSLAWVECLLHEGQSLEEAKEKDSYIRKYSNQIVKLLNFARKDKVRFYITKTVYYENRHVLKNSTGPIFHFAKNLCYFPDVKSKEYKTMIGRARALADTYCDSLPNGAPAPMKKTYSAYACAFVPQNDAFVMAESTTAGCDYVLTNNGRDYIFNEKIDTLFENSRRDAILQINRTIGYGRFDKKKNMFISTKPVNIAELVKSLEKPAGDYAYLQADDSKFKRLKEINLNSI